MLEADLEIVLHVAHIGGRLNFLLGHNLSDDRFCHRVGCNERGPFFVHLSQKSFTVGIDKRQALQVNAELSSAQPRQFALPAVNQQRHPFPFQSAFELEGEDFRIFDSRDSQHGKAFG